MLTMSIGEVSKMKDKYEDLPAPELLKLATKIMEDGGMVIFKYTCEKCGLRQFMGDTPNTIYEQMECLKCGHITHITKGGFLAIFPVHSHESSMT